MPTARFSLPFPSPPDPADGPGQIQALATAVDTDLLGYAGTGTLAARPAAAIAGRQYFATDTGQAFWDTGAAWTAIGAPPTANARIGRTSTPYALPSGLVPIFFNGTLHDSGGMVDLANFRIVAPHAGPYLIAAQAGVTTGGAGGEDVYIAIQINGVTKSQGNRGLVRPQTGYVITDVLNLAANDGVQAAAFIATTGQPTLAADAAGLVSYLSVAAL